jgi:uncharacterized protein CbrC (UPF0167 family)
MGRAGWDEVTATPGAVESLTVEGWREELRFMRADGDLTGYLFRCRRCGTGLAYADSA